MTILFPYMARWNSANRSRYFHLFSKIAEAGHTVIVVQPPARRSDETNYIEIDAQERPNIVLHTVPIWSWLWNSTFPFDKLFKKALYTVSSVFALHRLVSNRKIDMLVVYNLPQYVYTFRSKIPILFDVADDYIAMLQAELHITDHHPISKLGEWMFHRLIINASAILSVSHVLHQSIDHRNKYLLPNGADIPFASPETLELHIDRAKPVIGYVGAFEYFVDLDIMLRVAKDLSQYNFLLVGAGREFSRVKEQVTTLHLTNVVLTGAVPHSQAMSFISEMDVCLNLFVKGPVADGASPIKLFEYLAKGKPVVSSRTQELLWLDEKGDLLYFADSANEVKEQIENILRDVPERRRRSKRGKELVRSRYNWRSLADDFIAIAERACTCDGESDLLLAHNIVRNSRV